MPQEPHSLHQRALAATSVARGENKGHLDHPEPGAFDQDLEQDLESARPKLMGFDRASPEEEQSRERIRYFRKPAREHKPHSECERPAEGLPEQAEPLWLGARSEAAPK